MQRLFIICCLLATHNMFAQTVTGSWYGRADVEMAGMHNNYLTELVLKQNGNRVDGVFGYYFRDKYQSFFVHGRYNPKTREVIIQNIPVIYFNSNSTVNSIDCNTNFIGVILHSKVQSTIKGSFYHDEKYKYLCPDLKVTYTLDRDEKQDNLQQVAAAAKDKIWKPQADDVVVDAVKTPPPVAKTIERTPTPVQKVIDTAQTRIIRDTAVARVETPAMTIDTALARQTAAAAAAAALADSMAIAESFSKRKEIVTKVLDVESDSVRLSFYDNGDIDGDSISVFVNSQVVLTHQLLAAKALTMYLHLDSTRDINEIGMFAENLGKFPPNTALMIVTDGKNRYEVFMSSSLTENATIQIRRKKSP